MAKIDVNTFAAFIGESLTPAKVRAVKSKTMFGQKQRVVLITYKTAQWEMKASGESYQSGHMSGFSSIDAMVATAISLCLQTVTTTLASLE